MRLNEPSGQRRAVECHIVQRASLRERERERERGSERGRLAKGAYPHIDRHPLSLSYQVRPAAGPLRPCADEQGLRVGLHIGSEDGVVVVRLER